MPTKVIAIDGPAGVGKSSLGKRIAAKINFKYLDSGSLYRAIAFFGIDKLGSNFPNKLAIVSKYFTENPQTVQLTWSGDQYSLLLAGEDVTDKLQDEKIIGTLKIVSQHEPFRKFINRLIIHLGSRHDIVIDGRDIGTEVFPNAWKKFFCTADLDTRAQRRAKQLNISYPSSEFDEIKAAIKKRDESDTTRKIAPLRKADDAILIDTSKLSLDESVSLVLSHLDVTTTS